MNENERNLGVQPFDKVMDELGLKNHDLVAASTENLTHKQVQKGRKGRRITPKLQRRILDSLNTLAEVNYEISDIFTY